MCSISLRGVFIKFDFYREEWRKEIKSAGLFLFWVWLLVWGVFLFVCFFRGEISFLFCPLLTQHKCYVWEFITAQHVPGTVLMPTWDASLRNWNCLVLCCVMLTCFLYHLLLFVDAVTLQLVRAPVLWAAEPFISWSELWSLLACRAGMWHLPSSWDLMQGRLF